MRYLRVVLVSGAFALMLLTAACATEPPEPTPTPSETPTPSVTPTVTETPLPTATLGIRPETIASDPAQQVYLRVVHAALDTATVDVYVELLPVATNLDFGRRTESIGIVAGDYTLKVVPAGFGPDEPPLLQAPLSLRGGNAYILLFTGTSDAPTLSVYAESTAPLNAGESRVTVIHAVPRGADFVLRDGNTDLTPPLAFGQQSAALTLPAGRHNLIFLSGPNILTTQAVDLRERRAHTLILVGRPDDINSLSVIDFETLVPGRSSVRVVNAAPLAGPLDVYLNDERIAQNVEYGRASERQTISTTVYSAKVYAAGANPADIEPLTVGQLNANPDDIITLIVVGPPENLQIATYREDLSATPSDKARVVFVNTLETVPRVRLEYATGPVEGVPDLGYGQVSPPVLLDVGSTSFYWKRVQNNIAYDPVEIAENVQFESGRVYLYLFTGRMDAPPVVLSDKVEIVQVAPGSDPDAPPPTPPPPVNVRFVNAISTGTLVDFLVDDVVLAAAIPYSAGSNLGAIAPGSHVITVRNAGSTTLLARLESDFDITGNYSLFAYGSETASQIDLLLVPDFSLVFDDKASHLRLVNLTQDVETRFALAYSEPLPGPAGETSVGDESTSFRVSLPIGTTRLVDNIGSRRFSDSAPGLIGPYSLIVVDSQQGGIAARIPSIELQAGVHYDVVAFQEFGSLRVRMFAIAYPSVQQ